MTFVDIMSNRDHVNNLVYVNHVVASVHSMYRVIASDYLQTHFRAPYAYEAR